MANYYVQAQSFTLAGSGATTGDTSIVVNSFTDIDGNNLTMADFGAKGYGTIQPNEGLYEESFTFTGITQNANGTATLTGVKTAGFLNPYTETSGLAKSHNGNATIVVSNTSAFYANFGNKNNNETISGAWTFSQKVAVGAVTSSDLGYAATVSFVLSTAVSGAADASTLAKGISRISASPNTTLGAVTITIASPAEFTYTAHGLTEGDSIQLTTTGALPTGLSTSTNYYVIAAGLTANTFRVSATFGGVAVNTSGSQSGVHTLIKTTPVSVSVTDTRLPTQGEKEAMAGNDVSIAVGTSNKFITQTGLQKGAEVYAADAGAVDDYVITLSPVPTQYYTGMRLSFKANTANTGSATLNVNSLGAKTIKKNYSSDLETGDIVANQLVEVEYDGTNFQLMSPTASSATASTINTELAKRAGMFQQVVDISQSSATAVSGFAADAAGTVAIFCHLDNTSAIVRVQRFTIDQTTGQLNYTHQTQYSTGNVTAGATAGVAILGSYVYISFVNTAGPVTVVRRFDLADLANGTNMTISGTAPSTSSNNKAMYTDGTDLYINSSTTTWYRYTISGTTITNAATVTSLNEPDGAQSDGTNVYFRTGGTIDKYTHAGTSVSSATYNAGALFSTTTGKGILVKPNTYLYTIQAGTYATRYQAVLTPFAKI